MSELSDTPALPQTIVPSGERLDQINHISYVSDQLSQLYLSPHFSDITLLVDNERLPALRALLSARSPKFLELLYDGQNEKPLKEFPIVVPSLESFKHLLKYLYSGRLEIKDLEEEIVLQLLGLSRDYRIQELEKSISAFLKNALTVDNVCAVYDRSNKFLIEELANDCRIFIDKHPKAVLEKESFLKISDTSLKDLISRDSYSAPEIDIFKAVFEWTQKNSVTDPVVIKEIMSCIRLPLINDADLRIVVRNSKLVTAEEVLDAMDAKNSLCDEDMGCLIPESNLFCRRFGAQVEKGINGSLLLTGIPLKSSNDNKAYAHHLISSCDTDYDSSGEEDILEEPVNEFVIALGMPYIINHIRLLLWDKNMRQLSYYIELSKNKKDWIRVVDKTGEKCQSWQELYFPSRVTKYIRIVGTDNTVDRYFHILSFICMFTKTVPQVNEIVQTSVDQAQQPAPAEPQLEAETQPA